jgi:hypothetical protein
VFELNKSAPVTSNLRLQKPALQGLPTTVSRPTTRLIRASRSGKVFNVHLLVESPVVIHMREKSEPPFTRLQAFGPRLTSSTARQLQEDASRNGAGMMWVVIEEGGYFVAFAVTEDGVGSGWLVADSLAELRQHLPSGLARSDIQPSETPGVIEIWGPA